MTVGSGQECVKVVAGDQVRPRHLTLTRTGHPAHWRTVGWTLLPHHQTFLNLAPLEEGVAVSLKPGDIIGVGCPDNRSSRRGAEFTVVYKLTPPEASLETAGEIEPLSDLLQLADSLPGELEPPIH